MNDLFFQNENHIYSVNLSREAYKQMLCYCSEATPHETGGILIGNYSHCQSMANILQITPPPKNSTHSKCNFRRSSSGLKEILDIAWNQGQYYLGEWHYHPNSLPLPSHIDKNQMIRLSQDNKLNCPEPILIIIGGHKDLWSISTHLYVNGKEIILKQQPLLF